MATVQHKDLTGTDLHVNKLHKATHQTGGTDPIPIDKLDVPSDNTDLDASITAHGLMPKLPNDSAKAFMGDGSWAVPGGVPTGTIAMWATEVAPTGWLLCDGTSCLRASYAGLFAVIGTMYGTVDGTHFTLPDMRGMFVRGMDGTKGLDPDKATRTNRGDGTVGNHVGTKQTSQYISHYHTILGHKTVAKGSIGGTCEAVDTATTENGGASGGLETRPININMCFIIKT